jgi:DNA-binding transcriptional regulator YdaS (Cro superfamily)
MTERDATAGSVAWLARELGTNRTYLAAIASGRRHASADLAHRIDALLAEPAADLDGHRLDRVRRNAAERMRWDEVRQLAASLADAIERALTARDRN